jgi:hypothetical protein
MPSLNTGNAILSNAIAVDSSYNVGIGGAASGSFKFIVSGASAFSGNNASIAAISGYVGGVANNPIITFARGGSAVAGALGYDDPSASIYAGTTTNHNFLIKTNNSTRLTIDNAGAATFSSSVTATDQIKVSGSGAYLSIYDTQASSKNWAIRAGHDAVGDLAIRQSNSTGGDPIGAGTTRLYITSGGNVGIGTSSIVSTYGFTRTLSIENASNAELQLKGSTGTMSIGTTSGFNYFQSNVGYDFQTGGSSKMVITSGGNVLIGTTTDAGYKLDVNGTGRFSSNLRLETGSSDSLIIFKNNASSNVRSLSYNVADASFSFNSTGGSQVAIISNSGAATFSSLAGTGSRAVLADSSGTLSAPVSDISVKHNIKTIEYGLNEILKMNPVWFDFIDEYKNYGEGRQNGMIAQEVAEVIPEAVFTTPSTGKMGINYDQLHAVYIKAIQELKAEIEQLKNK